MATQNLPALQQKANTIRALFEKDEVKRQLSMAIPRHLSVDRLLRVAMTSIRTNPKLLDCTQESLLACIMGCAQLGLEPEPFLGQAYLVPYNRQGRLICQLIPGYRGYIALARRSGEVKSVTAQVVYENDRFEMEYGLEETLKHTPAEGNRGKPKGAYVIFRYKDDSHSFDYMSRADIEKIRERSKAKDSGPWVTDWDEMAKKTVIRRHIKLVPLSVEMATAAAAEEKAFMGESQVGLFTDTQEIEYSEVEEETGPVPHPAAIAEFDRLVTDHGFNNKAEEDAFKKFLDLTAKANNVTVDALKVQAATETNFKTLWTTFEQWKGKPQPKGKDPATGASGAPRGITAEQLEALEKAPIDIVEAGYKALKIDPRIPPAELDAETAEGLLAWLQKQ